LGTGNTAIEIGVRGSNLYLPFVNILSNATCLVFPQKNSQRQPVDAYVLGIIPALLPHDQTSPSQIVHHPSITPSHACRILQCSSSSTADHGFVGLLFPSLCSAFESTEASRLSSRRAISSTKQECQPNFINPTFYTLLPQETYT
jgi:hypothetical protein